MNFKKLFFAIQEKNTKDLEYSKDCSTIANLTREKKLTKDDLNTVHHRRDLDSIG